MPRLQIHPNAPQSWDIVLRPGTNVVGRGDATDVRIDDPSVSTLHCEIVVTDRGTTIKDLGSTNGTFVNHEPVQHVAIQPGHTLHLGSVEMRYHADAPAAPTIVAVQPVASPLVPPPKPLAPASPPDDSAPRHCKHHPKTIARFLCGQCHIHFCELCISSRNVGGVLRKFCRNCGAEATPLRVRIQRPVEIGYFRRLPGAFAYPFRGTGVLVLIVGMLLFAGLRFAGIALGVGSFRTMTVGVIMQVFVGGYLFSYLQNIIHSTIAEDQEMPDLPSMSNFVDDILMPFLRLLGLTLICFAPMILLSVWYVSQHEPVSAVALISTGAFGCLYFPMAFLAVATLDSAAAANPLVVVPSICKVPLEYLVTVILLSAVFGVRAIGDASISYFFGPASLITHSMKQLLGMFAARVFWSFTSLYLLTVTMRILGLLYLTKKDQLGWHSR